VGTRHNTHGIIVLNDTGSDLLTLFTTDLPRLGNIQGYTGWHAPMGVTDANGTLIVFPTIHVQVQLVRDDNTPWAMLRQREEWIRFSYTNKDTKDKERREG
jgi:hypothetical protein